ncbi:hypothetical protein SAMN05661107_3111 [Maritimibacter sp. HL-12]|nr:hypothetical protein SAMN05661107_3111 [Maritimibacter sp. HL-12]
MLPPTDFDRVCAAIFAGLFGFHPLRMSASHVHAFRPANAASFSIHPRDAIAFTARRGLEQGNL